MTVIKAFWRFVVIMLVLIFCFTVNHFTGCGLCSRKVLCPKGILFPALAADLEETERNLPRASSLIYMIFIKTGYDFAKGKGFCLNCDE